MEKLIYKNLEFGNVGMIEEVLILPYKDAKRKTKGYRVVAMAAYENNFIYHVSVFETLEEAKADLKALCFET